MPSAVLYFSLSDDATVQAVLEEFDAEPRGCRALPLHLPDGSRVVIEHPDTQDARAEVRARMWRLDPGAVESRRLDDPRRSGAW